MLTTAINVEIIYLLGSSACQICLKAAMNHRVLATLCKYRIINNGETFTCNVKWI